MPRYKLSETEKAVRDMDMDDYKKAVNVALAAKGYELCTELDDPESDPVDWSDFYRMKDKGFSPEHYADSLVRELTDMPIRPKVVARPTIYDQVRADAEKILTLNGKTQPMSCKEANILENARGYSYHLDEVANRIADAAKELDDMAMDPHAPAIFKESVASIVRNLRRAVGLSESTIEELDSIWVNKLPDEEPKGMVVDDATTALMRASLMMV